MLYKEGDWEVAIPPNQQTKCLKDPRAQNCSTKKRDTKLIIGWGDRAAELAYKGRLCGNLQKIQLQGPPMQTS